MAWRTQVLTYFDGLNTVVIQRLGAPNPGCQTTQIFMHCFVQKMQLLRSDKQLQNLLVLISDVSPHAESAVSKCSQ